MISLAHLLNSAATAVFDLIHRPASALGPSAALAVFALLTALLLLAIFHWTADRERIIRRKEKIQADLLALRLFQRELRVFWRLQFHLLRDSLAYVQSILKPMLILCAPLFLCLIQLENRFAARPLAAGETALVQVEAVPGVVDLDAIAVRADAGLVVETPGVRHSAARQITWRIRARSQGVFTLTVDSGRGAVKKKVVVGLSGAMLAPVRTGTGALDLLLHPGAPPIDPAAGIAAVAIDYPSRTLSLAGWQVHWSVHFLLLTIVFVQLGKAFLGVEI